MSTNYYLINKRERNIKKELDKLFTTELGTLKNRLYGFNSKYDLDREEEIEEKIRNVENDLDWGIFEPEVIHICKTNHDTLTWQINEYFSNEEGFIDFYYKNKDKYYIEDECKEVLTLEELSDKIYWDGQKVKYLNCDFM